VRFNKVPNSKNAIPEPSAPKTIVEPIRLGEKVVERIATRPRGDEIKVEIATTRNIKDAGE